MMNIWCRHCYLGPERLGATGSPHPSLEHWKVMNAVIWALHALARSATDQIGDTLKARTALLLPVMNVCGASRRERVRCNGVCLAVWSVMMDKRSAEIGEKVRDELVRLRLQ